MKGMKARIIFSVTLLLLACAALAGVYYFMGNSVDHTSVDYILQYQETKMVFNDPGNTIRATSPDVCGYKVLGNLHLDIKYGDMIIHVVPAAFDDAEFMRKLEKCGIDIKFRKLEDGTYQYKVTYWGEPIDEYSRF